MQTILQLNNFTINTGRKPLTINAGRPLTLLYVIQKSR